MNKKSFGFLYWFFPLSLFLLQAIFTLNSFNQIRYEELAEGVRNPWWIANHMMYDGISSNVGWYFPIAVFNSIYGFQLFWGKFLRLGLSLVSLFALALVLRKYLGEKLAWVPLVTIGLSPTLLYFNTQQTSYGIDLQYLPICLFFLAFGLIPVAWFFAMFAWLSYPTFVVYLPAMAIFSFLSLRKKTKGVIFKNISLSLFLFLLPLIFFLAFITNKQVMIADPVTHSGLFRGAGVLGLNLDIFVQNLKLNLVNLFGHSYGYNFELYKVEFWGILPIFSLMFLGYLIIRMIKTDKKMRPWILLILSVFGLSMLVAYFSVDPTPGIRRATGILAAIYGLFTLGWYLVMKLGKREKIFKMVAVCLLAIVPLQHLLVYPMNFVHLKDRSVFADDSWFSQSESPSKFLSEVISGLAQQDIKLMCNDVNNKPVECRYSEVYAALAASCKWNRIICHDILGYDEKSKQFIPLTIDLWGSYYFEH